MSDARQGEVRTAAAEGKKTLWRTAVLPDSARCETRSQYIRNEAADQAYQL